LVPPRGASV